jgi:phage repressor protein C with HTH and peptisase S24 domain
MAPKQDSTPEWANRLRGLLDRMNLTQAGLAERLGVSPATVSRWLSGHNEPTADKYVALGNLARVPEGIYFWERAGVDAAALPDAELQRSLTSMKLGVEDFNLIAGQRVSGYLDGKSNIVAIPLLSVSAFADERAPERLVSLSEAIVEDVLTAPLDWCPHADSIVAMHVEGDSMYPTISSGAIIVVDTASTQRERLHHKIVVVGHKDLGFKVARLQKLSNCYLLVSANHKCMPVDITNAAKWKIFGEVLWWVSRDTEPQLELAAQT